MKKFVPVHEFTKTGFWLAVVIKRKGVYIVAVAKEPKRALDAAMKAGYNDAALMRSAKSYGAFTSIAYLP